MNKHLPPWNLHAGKLWGSKCLSQILHFPPLWTNGVCALVHSGIYSWSPHLTYLS